MNKALSGRRILVVEDEMLLSLTIQDTLAKLGCETVAAATTSEKAVALIEGQVFDAAVLDMNLNGDSSSAWLRRSRPEGCHS